MQPQPIELHYWPTPNGHKITIMLEECGVASKARPAVSKAVRVGEDLRRQYDLAQDKEAQKILFGQRAR